MAPADRLQPHAPNEAAVRGCAGRRIRSLLRRIKSLSSLDRIVDVQSWRGSCVKQRFSELVQRVEHEGPQVVSAEEYGVALPGPFRAQRRKLAGPD